MKTKLLNILFLLIPFLCFSQISNKYSLSFSNTIHHEIEVRALFTNLESGPVTLKMSSSIPESLKEHFFSKNITKLKVTNSKGKELKITTSKLNEWQIQQHDGTINISYSLFANKGDGINSIANEALSLLNGHSTYIYIEKLNSRPVEVRLKNYKSYNWNIATQLEKKNEDLYLASDLDMLLNSPILLSKHITKEFRADVYGTEYTLEVSFLKDDRVESGIFEYITSNFSKVIEQEKKIFGNYPDFTKNKYNFIIVTSPLFSDDSKSHKNSSLITTSTEGNIKRKIISSLASTFFSSWNSKRMVPTTLSPFDYSKLNLTEELWFSEGFTKYYTDLILCRSGIISKEEYLAKVSTTYNSVWVSSALESKNILELSKLAPLNLLSQANKNLYVSHKDYGYIIALALDLELRDDELNLDDFLQLFWTKYGKTETPYNVDNIFVTLREYASSSFADDFFEKFIFESEQPEYLKLLDSAGVIQNNEDAVYSDINLKFTNRRLAVVSNYPIKSSPAYKALLEKGDIILSIDNQTFSDETQFDLVLSTYKPGKKVLINYKRLGKDKSTELQLEKTPKISLSLDDDPSKKAIELRNAWLNEK